MKKHQRQSSHICIINIPENNFVVVLIIISLVFFVVPFAGAQKEDDHGAPADDDHGYTKMSQLKVSPALAVVLVCLIISIFMVGCLSVHARQCVDSFIGNNSSSSTTAIGEAFQAYNPYSWRRATGRVLDRVVIDAFPTFVYSDVKGHNIGKAGQECAVCLNEFEDEETLRLVPKCHHVFHRDCIDTWFSSHVTCPVCRADLIPVSGEESELNNSLCCDSVTESTQLGRSPGVQSQVHEVSELAIDLHISSPEVINASSTINHYRSPQLAPTGVNWKYLRSHSTGHSLIQPGDDWERFALRSPEDVQKMLMQPELRREKSHVEFPRARSSKKGFRSRSVGTGRERNNNNNNQAYYEQLDRNIRPGRWGFTMTPPFISRTGSTSSPKEPVGGNNTTSGSLPFKSVR